MSIGPNDPKALNQAAAHDTALYDRSIQDNQIVALYDTEDDARVAMGAIIQAGFPAASMQVMPREQGSEPPQTGALGTLKSLFVPDQARTTQNPAVAHGHAMLIVSPDLATDRQHLVKVIEATKPLDFDSRLEQWRQAGYDANRGGQWPGGVERRDGRPCGRCRVGAPQCKGALMPETKAAPDAAEKKGSLPADTGKNPNATPDASTSGANSPKK